MKSSDHFCINFQIWTAATMILGALGSWMTAAGFALMVYTTIGMFKALAKESETKQPPSNTR